MLYLIVNESGRPEHRWSVEPAVDFKGLAVLGEAIKDENGFPEDSANLEMIDGKVTVNLARKNQAKADQVQKEKDRKDREARLKTVDWSKANTVAALRAILQDIVERDLAK